MTKDATKEEQLRQDILEVLREEFEGVVVDPSGRAAGTLRDAVFEYRGEESSVTAFSGLLAKMEKQGDIVRDQPTLKTCSRIALNIPGVSPAIKHPRVVMEVLSRTISEQLEGQYEVLLERLQKESERAEGLSEENRRLREQARNRMRRSTTNGERGPGYGELEQQLREKQATIDQLFEDKRELHEALRLAEHNVEIWKRNALRRTEVREVVSSLTETLDDKTKRDLQRLMTELPAGGP